MITVTKQVVKEETVELKAPRILMKRLNYEVTAENCVLIDGAGACLATPNYVRCEDCVFLYKNARLLADR